MARVSDDLFNPGEILAAPYGIVHCLDERIIGRATNLFEFHDDRVRFRIDCKRVYYPNTNRKKRGDALKAGFQMTTTVFKRRLYWPFAHHERFRRQSKQFD